MGDNMKLLTLPSSIDEINRTKDKVDGFIIGIKDMCVNTNFCVDNLSILNSLTDKDIFISMNKNMHNSDLSHVEELLLELNNYPIKGVLFYDIGVLNIYNRLNLNYELVWSQEHLTTNYNTINYWNSKGAKYVMLSNDITFEEIKDIEENSKSKLIVQLFGYLPMFVSKRHIVRNYLNQFDLHDNSSVNYMEKEGNTYPIIDDNVGTHVYSAHILNGVGYTNKTNCEYILLNSFNIDIDDFIKVIEMFKNVNESNSKEYEERINSMFSNTNLGFLDTKTIYRVKKNEK